MYSHPPDNRSLRALRQLVKGSVLEATAGLIGCRLCRRLEDGSTLSALIVETEAYHQSEPGSHAYRGMTPRNAMLFGPPGQLYVYFTYGMWYCANVVCEAEGTAAGVLLRAASHIPEARGAGDAERLRLSGPGLLCRGLQLGIEHNGAALFDPVGEVWLEPCRERGAIPLSWTTRIGFSFEDDKLWRCLWTGHPDISPARTGVLRRPARKPKD